MTKTNLIFLSLNSSDHKLSKQELIDNRHHWTSIELVIQLKSEAQLGEFVKASRRIIASDLTDPIDPSKAAYHLPLTNIAISLDGKPATYFTMMNVDVRTPGIDPGYKGFILLKGIVPQDVAPESWTQLENELDSLHKSNQFIKTYLGENS